MWKSFSVITVLFILILLSIKGIFVARPLSQDIVHDNIPESRMEFVFIKGGCFEMGDVWGNGYEDEKPVHEVCVDDFSLGKYEVTQSQWKLIMGDNPSKFVIGDNHPVQNIMAIEVDEFIKKLNFESDETYRLPTEAEWEFAARSGGQKLQYATDTGRMSRAYCNYDATEGNDTWDSLSPVGSFLPNQLELFDMCGNVWEIVKDSYVFEAYSKRINNNPLLSTPDADQVIRGCGWSDAEEDCRTTSRARIAVDCPICGRRNDVGFRLVKVQ